MCMVFHKNSLKNLAWSSNLAWSIKLPKEKEMSWKINTIESKGNKKSKRDEKQISIRENVFRFSKIIKSSFFFHHPQNWLKQYTTFQEKLQHKIMLLLLKIGHYSRLCAWIFWKFHSNDLVDSNIKNETESIFLKLHSFCWNFWQKSFIGTHFATSLSALNFETSIELMNGCSAPTFCVFRCWDAAFFLRFFFFARVTSSLKISLRLREEKSLVLVLSPEF